MTLTASPFDDAILLEEDETSIDADPETVFAAALHQSEAFSLRPDEEVQPLTEGQFEGVVRDFRVRTTRRGTVVYERADQPWQYTRDGLQVTAWHRDYPLPLGHYRIV